MPTQVRILLPPLTRLPLQHEGAKFSARAPYARMSEQQQVLDADPDAPIRNATQVAGYFRDDCRTLCDSLQLEMVVAQYHLQLRDVNSPEGIHVGEAISAAVVAELERHDDPLSHAILRGLEHLGTGDTAQRSADAVARLSERGVAVEEKFADVGQARATGAWRDSSGGWEDEYSLFVDFEHPLGRRHALALFVEPRHGGVIKHIGLIDPMSELDYPGEPESLDIPVAGTLLRKVLDGSFPRWPDFVDDYRVLIAAARARAMT
jgi:hypothetical protein